MLITKLTKLANKLDQMGYLDEADAVDELVCIALDRFKSESIVKCACSTNQKQGSSEQDKQCGKCETA